MIKKLTTLSVLSLSVIVSGCASNGGLATASSDGCNVGVSSALGAVLGAAAGYAVSKGNSNTSAQNNRAVALGALAGGALSAGICIAITAKTVQKRSAAAVEQEYKQQHGALPSQTKVTQYSTSLGSTVVSTDNNVFVNSDVVVIKGVNDLLPTLRETLTLKDSTGKVLTTKTKDVTQTGTYDSGDFGNSFTMKMPSNVSKGVYTIETDLIVNGKKAKSNIKQFTFI